MWGMHDGMGWWMVFGAVWMVLFWGAIIWLIAWAVSQFSRGGGGGSASALDIAKQRYARGEIDRDQYEQLRKDLA